MGLGSNKKDRKGNRRQASLVERVRDLRERASSLGARVGPTLLLTIIAVGLPYTVYHGYMHTVSSPYFNIKTIEIEGAKFVDREALLLQGGIAPGVNIFDIDLQHVAIRLEEHPWVASAKVTRKLPGHVTMTVVEHQPAAIMMDEGSFLLLDANGAYFKELEPRDPVQEIFKHLPLLSGLTKPLLESGDEEAQGLAREAITVSHLWMEMGLNERAALDHVHADPVLGLSLIVGDQGMEVRLGWGRWKERLERYNVVHGSLAERGVDVEYILIDQDDDIDRVAVGPARTKDR
ncbi:MAG: FtsQ-type POTRA domain-containing protein [Myxococcota bacterium]|jgi:cell division protein FtsQ|nr:FtsQ-type POTRA domain-containing protein [Myxococcota bacterium]